MWEAKVIAAAAAAAADAYAYADADADAETNWKHKVTPDWGDLMTEKIESSLGTHSTECTWQAS